MKMEFHGGRELEEALRELKLSTRKSIARKILKRAGQKFAERANALAPKGRGSRHLSGSYGVSSRLSKRQAAKVRKEGRDDVFMYAGTNDPAGQQQEFGNSRHPAQPHARPAFDETAKPMFDLIQDEMAGEVEKSVARARRKAARAGK
ncbi:HK97-gp10 family putative phage morphogenesis protein [Celeribacter ethanolicus]|uniref:HK97-gp10 family putative phage morphogenesis protein n=1 Tax=Celeribacter ethanolicus TaxID=1758178 RepID=UPI000834E63D|nr:HK97-gp10 family putative phage morphogenesis protein [Celeribacter ethanolicus]